MRFSLMIYVYPLQAKSKDTAPESLPTFGTSLWHVVGRFERNACGTVHHIVIPVTALPDTDGLGVEVVEIADYIVVGLRLLHEGESKRNRLCFLVTLVVS